MSTPSVPPKGRGWLDLLAILATGFLVRLDLILRFPAIHGGDSVARLAHSDQVFLAYQLPLPQLLVFLTRAADPDPFWTRLLFALIGAGVPVAVALAVLPALGPAAARIAAILLALHPLLLHYSTVPYQEGPMLLLLAVGAAALVRGRDLWGALFVGLACLCRYEAWIAAVIAALVLSRRGRPLRAAALFGAVPLAWVLFRGGGLSPPGTYVLDLDPLARLAPRLPFLLGKAREYSGDPLVLLGGLGALDLLRRRARGLGAGVAFVLSLLAVVTLAGHEFPPGSGLVSERLAHVPVVALCVLAGHAVSLVLAEGPVLLRVAGAGVLAVVALTGVWHATWLAATASADPSTLLARDVARFANRLMAPGETLSVTGMRIPPEVLDQYLARLARMGGDTRAAAALLAQMSRRGPDGDRVAAHLARSPRAVRGPDDPADWCAVFIDGSPRSADRSGPPARHRFVAAEREVLVGTCPKTRRAQNHSTRHTDDAFPHATQ